MLRFTRHLIRDERGQVLPLVLVLLLVGGLTITPALDHAATSLMACRTAEENVNGFFAADAGVQYAVWCLENSVSPPAQLAESINQMDVDLQVVDEGEYTLCFGAFIEAAGHSNYLGVSGEVVWDDPAQAYKYTITVTWQVDPGKSTIFLACVGARIPEGYTYQQGSAGQFPANLSVWDPIETLESDGSCLLDWLLVGPYVSQTEPVKTQTFYMTGPGTPEGYYAWVVAWRGDVGAVGEVTGELYTITATATRQGTGETTAEIVVRVLQHAGITDIVSWRVSK